MKSVFKDTELAYVAGLIDGDGSFSLIKGSKKGSVTPQYRAYVQFMKSDEEIVKYLQSLFDGHLGKKIFKTMNGEKVSHSWKLSSNSSVRPFLEKIIDFLIIKKERALFLKKYLEENPAILGKHLLSEETILKREAAHIKMKSFNHDRHFISKLPNVRKRIDTDNEVFWAYFAGLIDTDGSFSVKREKPSGESKSYRYSPIILLSMINYESMEYIMQNCSLGSFYVIAAKMSTQGFCYRFGLYSKEDCIAFINRVIPYLRIKKQQAEILISFCENFIAQNGQYLRTQKQEDFRNDCYERIKYLNANGVVKSPLMDLELLPDDAGDNKGQAAKAGSLNVASEENAL